MIKPFLKCDPSKTQGLSKNPRKNPRASEKTHEPKIRSKNQRSWEKTQGVATLKGRQRIPRIGTEPRIEYTGWAS